MGKKSEKASLRRWHLSRYVNDIKICKESIRQRKNKQRSKAGLRWTCQGKARRLVRPEWGESEVEREVEAYLC